MVALLFALPLLAFACMGVVELRRHYHH